MVLFEWNINESGDKVIDSVIKFLNSLSLNDICIIVLFVIICIFVIINTND